MFNNAFISRPMSVAGVYGTTGFIRVNGNPLEPHANTQLPNNVGAPGADGNGSAGNGTSKSNASGSTYTTRMIKRTSHWLCLLHRLYHFVVL